MIPTLSSGLRVVRWFSLLVSTVAFGCGDDKPPGDPPKNAAAPAGAEMVPCTPGGAPCWPGDAPRRIGLRVEAAEADVAKQLAENVRKSAPPGLEVIADPPAGENLVLALQWEEAAEKGRLTVRALGPDSKPLTPAVTLDADHDGDFDAPGRTSLWNELLLKQPNLFLFAAAAAGNTACQEEVLGTSGPSVQAGEDSRHLALAIRTADVPVLRAWRAILLGDFAAAAREGKDAVGPLSRVLGSAILGNNWDEAPKADVRRLLDCADALSTLPAAGESALLTRVMFSFAPPYDGAESDSRKLANQVLDAVASLLERAGDEAALPDLETWQSQGNERVDKRFKEVREAVWKRLGASRGRPVPGAPVRIAVRVVAEGWLSRRFAVEPALAERLKSAGFEALPADAVGVDAILLLDYTEFHNGDYSEHFSTPAMAPATEIRLSGRLVDLGRRSIKELKPVVARAESVHFDSSASLEDRAQAASILKFRESKEFATFGETVKALLGAAGGAGK